MSDPLRDAALQAEYFAPLVQALTVAALLVLAWLACARERRR